MLYLCSHLALAILSTVLLKFNRTPATPLCKHSQNLFHISVLSPKEEYLEEELKDFVFQRGKKKKKLRQRFLQTAAKKGVCVLRSDAKTKQNQKNDWTASKTKNALVHSQKRKRYRESRCTLCTSLAMTPLSPHEQLLFFLAAVRQSCAWCPLC